MMQSLKPCRCCGKLTITKYGEFEVCNACGWEDDEIQFEDPDFAGGANELSLNQAKHNLLYYLTE